MARIFTDIKAKEFLSGKKIKLEIYTSNDGAVISVHPCDEDRKQLLHTVDTVTLPKRIWDKIPYAFTYWDAKHNQEPAPPEEKEKSEE